MPTPIGLRRERVRLEQLVSVPDGQGGHWWGWALRAVVWAREEALTSREALMAKALTSVLQTAWTIAYRTDLSITDRLVVGARVLTLSSYQDVEGQRAELRLLAAEVQR
jgi:SPP1 family predicted phage head-tail adaptor